MSFILNELFCIYQFYFHYQNMLKNAVNFNKSLNDQAIRPVSIINLTSMFQGATKFLQNLYSQNGDPSLAINNYVITDMVDGTLYPQEDVNPKESSIDTGAVFCAYNRSN